MTGILVTFFSNLRPGLFQNLLCTPVIHPTCNTPHASHPSFDQRNNMRWLVNLTNLLVILTSTYRCLRHSKRSVHLSVPYLIMLSSYGEGFLAASPNINLHNHLFSALRDSLFSLFAAVFHIWRMSPPCASLGCAPLWWRGSTYHGTNWHVS